MGNFWCSRGRCIPVLKWNVTVNHDIEDKFSLPLKLTITKIQLSYFNLGNQSLWNLLFNGFTGMMYLRYEVPPFCGTYLGYTHWLYFFVASFYNIAYIIWRSTYALCYRVKLLVVRKMQLCKKRLLIVFTFSELLQTNKSWNLQNI